MLLQIVYTVTEREREKNYAGSEKPLLNKEKDPLRYRVPTYKCVKDLELQRWNKAPHLLPVPRFMLIILIDQDYGTLKI